MSKLEIAAQICLIGVSLTAGGLLLEKRFSPPHGAPHQRDDELVGKRLDRLSAVNWEQSPTNLVLFISTQCHFCEQSLPFYRRLTDTLRRKPEIALRVLSAEPPENVRTFLDWQQAGSTPFYQIRFLDPVLRATPTLVITDSHGVIKRAFIGKLDQAREKSLLDALQIDHL